MKPPFRSSRLLLVFRRRYANQTMTNSLTYIILAERFFRFMRKVDRMVNWPFNRLIDLDSLPIPRKDKNEKRNRITFVYNLDIFAKWPSTDSTLCLLNTKSMLYPI